MHPCRQHQCKLVAAKPRHDVRLAGAKANDRPDFDQCPASARWPWLSLIDEAVQIDEQQGNRPSGPPCESGFTTQGHVEVTAVIEAGEVVGDRQGLGPLQRHRRIQRETGRHEQVSMARPMLALIAGGGWTPRSNPTSTPTV